MLEFPVIPKENNEQIYNLLIIDNKAYKVTLPTLIDTGATISTWVGGYKSFKSVFPEAELLSDTEALLRGFGGSGEIAKVYLIPEYVLKDNFKNSIVFNNMPIIVTRRDYSFRMILSYTMLNKLNFEHKAYTYIEKKYIASNQKIYIKPYKDYFFVGYTRRMVSEFREEIQQSFSGKYCLDNTYIFAEQTNVNTLETYSQAETYELAKRMAQSAIPGDILLLYGDLGTGKTVFVQGFAAGLGIEDYVNSPTFTIMKSYYGGRLPLHHFDVYRIGSPEEMYDLDYEEYLYGDGVCLIEWAELIDDLLQEDCRIKLNGELIKETTNGKMLDNVESIYDSVACDVDNATEYRTCDTAGRIIEIHIEKDISIDTDYRKIIVKGGINL